MFSLLGAFMQRSICRGFRLVEFGPTGTEGSAQALRTAEGRRDSTRLETRTKESSAAASQRVLNPRAQ